MEVYNTKTLKEEYRVLELTGTQFNKCEICGVEQPTKGINIRYYHKTRKIMCDRCVDNYDGITVWSDEYAKKNGLPPYPRGR
jgi:recombinational DNA repair protein (RecF pathway)